MSVWHGLEDPCCDPEVVFELAEGALPPARRSEVRAHVEACPECQDLYEREKDLSRFLCSAEFAGLRERSVCRNVAMELPTRPFGARILWAALAAVMLAAALAVLSLNGTAGNVISAANILGGFWGYVSGVVDMFHTMFAIVGWAVLIALAVGALVDLIIAAAVVTVTRRT